MNTTVYPLYVLVLDYALGAIMWTLLARAVLDLFIAPDRDMVLVTAFRQVTNPVIRAFHKITPAFLAPPFIPVYVAWWFYLVRFYALPYLFFGQFGMLSFPLEGAIGRFLGAWFY